MIYVDGTQWSVADQWCPRIFRYLSWMCLGWRSISNNSKNFLPSANVLEASVEVPQMFLVSWGVRFSSLGRE